MALHSLSLRSVRSALSRHDRYLEPFPDDIDASFAALLDALESHHQHHKVAALKALFRRGLLPLAQAESDQVDFGHRVLLFLMKIKGRVVESRVDEGFIRSFMRMVGSKKRREAELMMEQERVRRLLAEEDMATEEGRWWRQVVSYSSDDDLSDWSDASSDSGSGRGVDDEQEHAGDADREECSESTDATPAPAPGCKQDNEYGNIFERRRHRLPLPLLREPTARSAHERDGCSVRDVRYGHAYSDPRSLAVWLAAKSHPTSTHLSECLNPRQCLGVASFIEQLLNSVLGFEQPGSMVHIETKCNCGDCGDCGDCIDCDRAYVVVEGVHTEGVSTEAAAAVAREVLDLANGLRRADLVAACLPRAISSSIARHIRVCRLQLLESRPQTLAELLHACSAVQHRAALLDEVVTAMASAKSTKATSYADKNEPIKSLIDEFALLCSSGVTAASMGVLIDLLLAGEDVPVAVRTDARRICREYMDSIVICGDSPYCVGSSNEKIASVDGPCPSSPSTAASTAPRTKTEGWWDEECEEMAQSYSYDVMRMASLSLKVPQSPPALFFDVQLDADAKADKQHYRMMEESSKRAMGEYQSRTPFQWYDSLDSVKVSVLKKIGDVFDGRNECGVPDGRDLEQQPPIYPLPPSIRLEAMKVASAPRLDASQVARLAEQIIVVQRVCQLPFPHDALDDDLRPLVESVWASGDISGSLTHHISFRAPLSDVLGAEARRALSTARRVAVSLQAAWTTAVDARRQSLNRSRVNIHSYSSLSAQSTTREHVRDLAAIVRLRERQREIDAAFWDFSRTAASVISPGADVKHVARMMDSCFVKLAHSLVEVSTGDTDSSRC